VSEHYRHCQASEDPFADCTCADIEAELRAEWIDEGAPEDWDVSA
jgi:hypothetical protein